MTARLREIPYNYTSFSDREIVIRLLDIHEYLLEKDVRLGSVNGARVALINCYRL